MQGYLVHIQRTYPAITPYLKSIYLTLDFWQPGRDDDGWKQQHYTGAEGYWDEQQGSWVAWDAAPSSHPEKVKPVGRLADDLHALTTLVTDPEPPLQFICRSQVHVAVYGFVDASAEGFGSIIQRQHEVSYCLGVWGRDLDSESSNFHELHNLVTTLEWCVQDGLVQDSEVSIFTDYRRISILQRVHY